MTSGCLIQDFCWGGKRIDHVAKGMLFQEVFLILGSLRLLLVASGTWDGGWVISPLDLT